MPDDLLPVPPADLEFAIGHALSHRRDGKRWAGADSIVLRIAVERIVEHLTRSGFVVMQRPPANPGPDRHYAPHVPGGTGGG